MALTVVVVLKNGQVPVVDHAKCEVPTVTAHGMIWCPQQEEEEEGGSSSQWVVH